MTVYWSWRRSGLTVSFVIWIGGSASDFEEITNSRLDPGTVLFATLADIGRNAVAGSVVQVTETLVTLAVAVPEPFATTQVGPGGCVRTVTEYAAPLLRGLRM